MNERRNPIQLLCVMPSLGGGGAEKMFVKIVNWIFRKVEGVELKVLLICDIGINRQGLDNRIEVDCLNSNSLKSSPVKIYKYLRESKPDVVFSNMTQLNLIMAILKPLLNFKLIVRETNIPSIEFSTMGYPSWLINIYKFLYTFIDFSVFQSIDMRDDFQNFIAGKEGKYTVINNSVERSLMKTSSPPSLNSNDERIKVICVGRLVTQKGFDKLIDNIALHKCVDIDFDIYGEGPMKRELEDKLAFYKLSNVTLKGFCSELDSKWQNYNLCVVSSLHEGFPNFVLESLQNGVPVWSTRFKGGINEIIDSSNGKIFNNLDLLIEELKSIREIKFDKETIVENTLSKFGDDKISAQYINVFKKFT